jgi:hypothetical protein
MLETTMRTAFFLILAACGNGTPTEPAAAAPKVTAAPPKVEEAPPGPDGPADIAVPDLGPLVTDPAGLAKGEAAFAAKGCSSCHAWGSKLVGPDLTGVTDRRSVTWVERMIRHPDVMTKRDPIAKELLKTHMVQMPDQKVNDEELAMIVAFLDSHKGS